MSSQILPLIVYGPVWKTEWIMSIALPAWLSDGTTAEIKDLFYECAGIVVVYFAIPWRYVFACFFAQPARP